MKNLINLSFIALFCLIYYSCKEKSTQPDPVFEGITETFNGPEPTGTIDPDDWRPMMDCSSLPKVFYASSVSDTVPEVHQDTSRMPKCLKIYPAYPNPSTNTFTIQYSLIGTDSVYMTLNDAPTHILKEVIKSRQVRGMYSVTIDASDLSPGIYRVYITVFRQANILHSYGDINIVK